MNRKIYSFPCYSQPGLPKNEQLVYIDIDNVSQVSDIEICENTAIFMINCKSGSTYYIKYKAECSPYLQHAIDSLNEERQKFVKTWKSYSIPQQTNSLFNQFDKVIRCLALELPGKVFDDVSKNYAELKLQIARKIPEDDVFNQFDISIRK